MACERETHWLDTGPPQEALDLLASLRRRVLGQSDPLEAIANAVIRWRAGMAGLERPVASFLLLGPTGVGKTLTVEALAEVLHGDDRHFIKINCAEYSHGHEVSKLVGAPPGYVGWRETEPILGEKGIAEVRSKACGLALILFDEVEKAGHQLWDLLLGVLDKGELSTGSGVKVDLRETLIFFTGNTGSRELAPALTGGLGFRAQEPDLAAVSGIVEKAAAQVFAPEFRNRLTATFTFQALSQQDIAAIARAELTRLAERMERRPFAPLRLLYEKPLADFIAREGYDARYGARHVKRAIERLIEQPLANLVASGRILNAGARLAACLRGKEIKFKFP